MTVTPNFALKLHVFTRPLDLKLCDNYLTVDSLYRSLRAQQFSIFLSTVFSSVSIADINQTFNINSLLRRFLCSSKRDLDIFQSQNKLYELVNQAN